MKYELQVVNMQGKPMSRPTIFDSREEMLIHVKSHTKKTLGVGYLRMFPDPKNPIYTLIDYGSHTLFYRFKKL